MTTPELVTVIKKNPITVSCAVLSIALGAGIFFRSDAIPEANTELDQRAAEARRYALNISNGAQLKEQYEALVAANKAIEARLIRPSDIGINQQYFYKLEADTGVKLMELNQNGRESTPSKAAGVVPVTFTLTAQGSFPQILAFLRALENGRHLCRVVTASCTSTRNGAVSLGLTLELLGRP